MKVKVFEIVKTGLVPLSKELEETIQKWLDGNENIEILNFEFSSFMNFQKFNIFQQTLPYSGQMLIKFDQNFAKHSRKWKN